MRTSLTMSSVAVAAIAFFSGCSGASLSSTPPAPNRLVSDALNSAKYAGLKDLYVADDGFGEIVRLKNNTYEPDGTITAGLNGPFDDTLDRAGNLYVANRTGDNIAEYAAGASQPSFVYDAGMVAPITLSVDGKGHVYEADVDIDGASFVNEYNQHRNSVLHTCPVPGVLQGVAVDPKGDVFTAYEFGSHGGRIAEYQNGLQGCQPTVLGARIFYPGNMVFDNNGNLIIADQVAARVYVIPPPYSRVERRLGNRSWSDPYHVSINGANTTMFVTDFELSVVFVVDYASGNVVQKLGYAEGLGVPAGTVDGPNGVH